MTSPNISPSAAERISEAPTNPVARDHTQEPPRERSGLTIAEIANLTAAKLAAGAPTDRRIGNVAELDAAGPADLTVVDDEKDLRKLAATRAGACLMPPRFAPYAPAGLVGLLVEEPRRAFLTVARALFPDALRPVSLFATDGRAASAQVHVSARIEAGVTIDPLAVIGPHAQVGAETVIAAGAAVGPGVCIGRRCAVGAGATIVHALLGDDVIIQPGARIGQSGFGARLDARGERIFPQTRRVIIQDDVEIGANATIDRGAARDTVIGEGTKVSNLVQIGRDAMIGRRCLIAAQVDLAAGATVGDFAIIGRAGVADDVGSGDGGTRAGGGMLNSDIGGETGSSGSAALPRGGGR
jgi:UDP-3-O-[3-hydroxymyristoyl] glucosamine N-acyltransferase